VAGSTEAASVMEPLRSQPVRVRLYGLWIGFKRAVLDTFAFSRWVRVLRNLAYIAFVIQSSLAFTNAVTRISWAFWLNMAVVVAFAISSILVDALPKRERRPRVSDVHHLRELETRVRNLRDLLEIRKGSIPCIEELGDAFTQQAFMAACNAVCADRDVRVTLMTEDDDKTLRVSILFPGDTGEELRPETTIPLTKADALGRRRPKRRLGVAGYAYGRCQSVYVPNTKVRAAYFVRPAVSGRVEYDWLGRAWKPSPRSAHYRSVISVPVFVKQQRKRRPLGVLNFESRSRDAFGSADFHVACLAAGLFAQGLAATMESIAECIQNGAGRATEGDLSDLDVAGRGAAV